MTKPSTHAPTSPTPRVITLGCRFNTAEASLIEDAATTGGFDGIVVNGCAVTAEARRQTRQTIRRWHRRGHQVIAAGCSAHADTETLTHMREVHRVLGNRAKLSPAAYAPHEARVQTSLPHHAPHHPHTHTPTPRAFLRAQDGCNHTCTFCITTHTRGDARSTPLLTLVHQAQRLVESGAQEIILTGIDLASWGDDLPHRPTLGTLATHILGALPHLARLRFSSLDPARILTDAPLLHLLAHEPRLMPHMHLSVQSGDHLILKRMKRRHTPAMLIRTLAKMRKLRPHITFSADLIAGFPTETDAQFASTLALAHAFTSLHVFPFSPHPHTVAARMPQVAGSRIRARAAHLRSLAKNLQHQHLIRLLHTTHTALMETHSHGRLPDNSRIALTAPAKAGTLIRVRVIGVENHFLNATPV